MTVRKASDGTAVTKATAVSNFGAAITQEAQYTVDQDYLRDFNRQAPVGGVAAFNDGRALLWKAGQVVKQSEIDAAFAAVTVSAISPTGGTTAGGTVTTITGTNFGGASGVTFGGTAGTAFSVVNDTTIKVTTPAKTAGAVNVVVTDDSGTATLTNGYTYS